MSDKKYFYSEGYIYCGTDTICKMYGTNEEMETTAKLFIDGIKKADNSIRKLDDVYDKYECPECRDYPDIIIPNINTSRCFRCNVKWNY